MKRSMLNQLEKKKQS